MQSKNAKVTRNNNSNSYFGYFFSQYGLYITIFIIAIIISVCTGGGNYYGHRGFYGGGYYGGGFFGGCAHSSCAHSSCACAHSSCAHSSCACACAGSGRAGCSLKDFYGTNITTEKIKKAFI